MSLEQIIKELIGQNGPITLAQYMSEALLNPQYGYYTTKHPFGKKGDFITAPEISQTFGELIGIWCASMWLEMDTPNDILLVELGPGRGTLMQDFLRGTKHIPNFHQSLQICMIEASPSLQKVQQQALSAYTNISWYDHIDHIPDKPILLVANEFFDALPIRQFVKTPEGWCERLVSVSEDNMLVFTLSGPQKISTTINAQHPNSPMGGVVEISSSTNAIIQTIGNHIATHTGAAVIIDYGYDHYHYNSTFQGVRDHHYESVLSSIGNTDLTAHIDFCAARQSFQSFDGFCCGPIGQGEFLEKLGIHARAEQLIANAPDNQTELIRSAIDRLICPEKMGKLFKVLAFANGIKSPVLGFQ